VKRDSGEFLGKPPSHFRTPKQHHVRIQALSSPEGVIVTDVRGITRVLNDHAKDELTSGIKNMPALSWARTKVRILSIRADLSSEQEDLSDALWCYQQLLEFVMKFPAIFPGEIWHAAVLANLADISEKLNNPPNAETYYLRALNSSYSRRGRYDNENVRLLEALAELCKNTGHLRGAAELFSRVLHRREEIA
jgi:tetratricopeptide (TPR) repeat protein